MPFAIRFSRKRKLRGNILAMAMAFMFVLVTIVIAMHTTQSRAVRNVTQAEAEIRFRQASEFAAADLMLGGSTVPSGLKVEADDELVGDFQMPDKFGTKLWTGLPDWDPKEGQKYAPGHRTYKLEPSTNDAALDVFAGKFQWLVCHNDGGYAVYAPAGTVKLEGGMGWANPNFTDERESAQAYSGVPLLVAAKGSIEIGKMPYGNAYSLDGPIDLGDDKKDLAAPYIGPFPMRPYEEALRKQLQDARGALQAAAASGNKSNDISGGVLAGVSNVLSMLMNGDASKLNVSLEQAMEFPFPMIPGFSATIPGVFFEFWFHMPYPPDFYQPESGDDGSNKKNAEDAVELDKKIKALEAEIKDLNNKIAAESDDDEKEDLIEERDDKQEELNDLKDEAESIQEQIEDSANEATSNIENNSSQQDVPQTRAEDADIPNTGIKGWAYGKLLGNMLGLLTSLISGDPEGIAESVFADVRVVHFGGKENDCDPGFRFNDGFFCEATFTVPRGRSFEYNGKMEVAGDLWLQKGSVMHVAGDLIVSNPDPGASNPLKPCGKVVMEEGATLIVDGDFRCEGDPRFGSLWVCTPPTHLAPVTTAIFVQNTATLPYGSFSATNLEDMARAVDGLGGVADALEVLFTDIVPNLSKVVGPFHERQPYFASYATTFQLTIVPTPVGPIPVPTPIPLPKKNVLIPFFRALTMVYTGTLNLSLGENLYAHSDWWGFGEGVVPAMVKLNPLGPLNSIKGLNLNGLQPDLDWEDYLTELTTTILQGAAEFAIKEVGKKLITNTIGSVVGGSLVSGILDEVLDAVDLKGNAFEEFRDKVMEAAVGPIVDQLEKVKDKLNDEIEDGLKEAYLREVGGPLIYAGSINVGDAGDPPLLMAGMLVAEDSLNVNTASFVGSLTCFKGNISAGTVYFTPVFTRASLYVPKATASNAVSRAVQYEYGKRFDSGQAVDIGTGVWQVTTEGWSR